jgi:hypothetical protein
MLALPAPANGEGQPKQPHHTPCGGGFLMANTIPSRLLISRSFGVLAPCRSSRSNTSGLINPSAAAVGWFVTRAKLIAIQAAHQH